MLCVLFRPLCIVFLPAQCSAPCAGFWRKTGLFVKPSFDINIKSEGTLDGRWLRRKDLSPHLTPLPLPCDGAAPLRAGNSFGSLHFILFIYLGHFILFIFWVIFVQIFGSLFHLILFTFCVSFHLCWLFSPHMKVFWFVRRGRRLLIRITTLQIHSTCNSETY